VPGNTDTDVIIIGAGPAGSSCALSLKGSGLSVTLLDQAIFPRDKVCGDALSLDVMNQLSILGPQVFASFESHADKTSSYGVRIFSPDETTVDIPFYYQGIPRHGYTIPRKVFDHFLYKEAALLPNVEVVDDCHVSAVVWESHRVNIHSSRGTFSAKMVIHAAGSQSGLSKFFGQHKINKKHHSAGLRIYFEGVTGFNHKNFIELYFFKHILPGYFWIFPLPDNKANVGIGVLSSVVSKKRLNLKKTILEVIAHHPLLKERFANARPLESPQGHGLALGSAERKISGERWLLIGDAAGLIDPFSGEGVGNAIRSGRLAAQQIMKCFSKDDFSADQMRQYDRDVYHKMGHEFKVSYALQKLCTYPWLFNTLMRKAARDGYWQQFLVEALANVDQKKYLTKPSFYYKLFFT
jgi:geranylgeranyl reductase family protein